MATKKHARKTPSKSRRKSKRAAHQFSVHSKAGLFILALTAVALIAAFTQTHDRLHLSKKAGPLASEQLINQ